MNEVLIDNIVATERRHTEELRANMLKISDYQTLHAGAVTQAQMMFQTVNHDNTGSTYPCKMRGSTLVLHPDHYSYVQPILRLHTERSYLDLAPEYAKSWLVYVNLHPLRYSNLAGFNINCDPQLWHGFRDYCGKTRCGRHPIELLISMRYPDQGEYLDEPLCYKHAIESIEAGELVARRPEELDKAQPFLLNK